MKKTFFIYAITLLIFSESCWSMQRNLTQGLRFARTPLSRYSLPRELPPVTRFNSIANTNNRFNSENNQRSRFSKLAHSPTLAIAGCFAIPDDEQPNDDDDNDIDTVIEDLKKILDRNKQLVINNKIKPIKTGQNIKDWILEHMQSDNNVFNDLAIRSLLILAIHSANYALVKEIINAMSYLFILDTQLYQAVKDGNKGIETLRNLLKKGASPYGYTYHFNIRENDTNDCSILSFVAYKYVNAKDDITREKYKKIFSLLVKKTSFHEDSPLVIAMQMGNFAAAQLLYEYGAYDSGSSIFRVVSV